MNSLLFEKIHNFRDMGGLATSDGRHVKKGLLFRCGELSFSTEKDKKMLQNLRIKVVVDYRDEDEVANRPSLVLDGIEVVRISARKTDSVLQSASVEELMKGDFLKYFNSNVFTKFYEELPLNNPAYKELIYRLINKQVPLIHHCTAGKDRTGVGAAIIYLLLGVPEEEIMEDYLLTNLEIEKNPPKWFEKAKGLAEGYSELVKLAFCDAIWLQAAMKKMIDKYGSYEAYFYEEFGITAEQRKEIQDLYLE